MLARAAILGMSILAMATSAATAATTVAATAEIYSAGGNTSLQSGATAPPSIVLPGGTVSVQFTSVTGSISCTISTEGCVSLNNGGNFNDPDGLGAAVGTSSNSGAGSISGITSPNSGSLMGLFVAAGGPSGPAPAALNFTTGSGTSFTSLSPLLDQTFFIGDGLTADGSGSLQTFYVPTGATALYLGISDACGYNGGPGCYGDNLGSFSVTASLQSGGTTVPEPGTLVLFGVGLLGLGCVRFRHG